MPSLLVAALLSLSTPPAAAAASTTVTLTECDDVNRDRFVAQLELELGQNAASATQALGVTLQCAADEVRIEVRDPATQKLVARVIPAPPPDAAERERVLALATSRLILASWLELLLEQESAKTAPDAPPSDVEPQWTLARSALQSTPPRPPVPRWRLVLAGGGAGRGLGRELWPSLAVAGGVAIAVTAGSPGDRVPRVSVDLGAAYERAWTRREPGNVVAEHVLGIAGARWYSAPDRFFGAGAGIVAGVGWGRVRGFPTDTNVAYAATDLVADVRAVGGPQLRWKALALELEFFTGMAFLAPTGLVPGESSSSTHGLLAGASLRLMSTLGGV
ncbi:MAG: hypothetical protein B7733_19785 [Myxococcales bacterium FL481]|nr:MAG: hypothetical protein B7733_19785 [Myxococcales bacterium FL481]